MNNLQHSLRVAIGLIVITAIAGATLRAQAKVDISGKWTFDVQTDAGGGTPTVTFKQDGEKLTGHYSSATLGEADLTGTVKGSNVTFTFDVDLGGQAGRVTYTATVESNNTMKGTIDLAGLASGTFTGKRS
jgi:hypothetical protein